MIIGDARVAARGQVSGTSLDEQAATLKSNGCEDVVTEQGTGASLEARPRLEELLENLQSGDTLMVCKLDRLARSVEEGIQIVRRLFQKGVKVHVLNLGLLEDSPMGRFFLQTLLAVAEFERELIMERTRIGREVARSKPGYKEGRPRKFTNEQLKWASRLKLEGHSYKEIEQMTQISKSTLQRFLWNQKLSKE